MSDEAYHRLMVLKDDRKADTVSEVIRDALAWLRTLEKHKDDKGEIKISKKYSDFIFEV